MINKLVAKAEARILTKLLPSKIAPIKASFLFNKSIATLEFFLPFMPRPVNLLRVLAVSAVSEPEKNAENAKRTIMAKNNTIISNII